MVCQDFSDQSYNMVRPIMSWHILTMLEALSQLPLVNKENARKQDKKNER